MSYRQEETIMGRGSFPVPNAIVAPENEYFLMNLTGKQFIGAFVLCHQNFIHSPYICDTMVSCDSQGAILRLTLSIAVVIVVMYKERWLAWLPKVCNYNLPV